MAKIIAFACNWCSYTAADLAGTTRLKMPADFTVIRVMCSGRVDPVHILRALALGADGVLVSGCHPGDCHYTSGNLHARKRVDFLKAVLALLGLSERLEMHYVSASEGRRFQEVVTEFDKRLERLGPSPLGREGGALPEKKREAFRALLLDIARRLAADIPEGAALPEELVAEGYGEPLYDAEKCLGCGACAMSCPEKNIEIADGDGERRILHFHSRCVACSTCQSVCPVEAVKVPPRFDLGAFLSDRRKEAVRLEMRTCGECGAPVAPARQIDYLVSQAAEKGGVIDAPELCEACRRKAYSAEMRRSVYPSSGNIQGVTR